MTRVTLDITEARRRFTRLDEAFEEGQVIHVTRRNKEAFAIVEPEYLKALLETVEILADPNALRQLAHSLEDIKSKRTLSHAAARKKLLDE